MRTLPYKKNSSSGEPDESIKWLGDSVEINATSYGVKASRLHELAKKEPWVPEAFVINAETVREIALRSHADEILPSLHLAFDQLVANSQSKKVIVRSSSLLEDVEEHQFPGFFKSVSNVTQFDELVAAIRDCFAHSLSPVIAALCEKYGIAIPSYHLALIVQAQIICDHSAIVQSSPDVCLLEVFKGDLREHISGHDYPTCIELNSLTPGRHAVRNNQQQLNISTLNILSSDVSRLIPKIAQSISSHFVLEIGWRNDEVFVFQIRHVLYAYRYHPDRGIHYKAAAPLLPNEKKLGLKAAAMKLFQERGLFSLPMYISSSEVKQSDLENLLIDSEWLHGPYTVRFSYNKELGLPRTFVSETGSLLTKIHELHQPGWTTIVHKYIEVRRSFELLLSSDMVLLEHVPGMWESDNKLQPDVLEADICGMRGWLWTENRQATVLEIDRPQIINSPPVSFEMLTQWSRKLKVALNKLQPALNKHLPLNIHFVEDSRGEWVFLNIRRGFLLEHKIKINYPVHIVEKADDMRSWDGKSSLLLRVSTDRGQERELLDICENIPKTKSDIFIDAGVLSHPAMFLREKGVNVLPAYMAHPVLDELSHYQEVAVNQSIFDDPIDRIMQEPVLYEDNVVRAVNDREPIVDKHILLLTNKPIPSFADLSNPSHLELLFHDDLFLSIFGTEKLLLVERGRAKFCTSEFTDCHAHGHVFPLCFFKVKTVDELIATTKAIEFTSLSSALMFAKKSSSEYFLFSINGEKTYLAFADSFVTTEKRFFRQFLNRRINNEPK